MAPIREIDRSKVSHQRRFGNGSYYDHQRDVLAVSLKSGSIAHVVAHEFGHYFDHVSTPYGFFLDRVNLSEIRCTFDYMVLHTSVDLPVLSPAYEFAMAIKKNDGAVQTKYSAYRIIKDEILNYVSWWSNVVFLRQALEEPGTLRDPSISQVLGSLAIFEGNEERSAGQILALDADVKLLSISKPAGDCPLAPYFDLQDNKVPFGAKQIFELLAILGEMNKWSDHLSNRQLDRHYSDLYNLSFCVALEMEIDLESPENYNYILKLMFLCGKLSLFTPIGSAFRDLRNGRDMSWRDIHPGYRFLRSIKTGLTILDRFGLLPFDQVQDIICDSFNWPSVADFVHKLDESKLKTFDERRFLKHMRLYAETNFCLVSNETTKPDEKSFRPHMSSDIISKFGPLSLNHFGRNILMRKDAVDRGDFIFTYYTRGLCNDVMLHGKFDEFLNVPWCDYYAFPTPEVVFPRFFEVGLQSFEGDARSF